MARFIRWDGNKPVEIGGGGGGGSSHTHPNLTLLNSITQAMVSAWQAAATWVTSNGSAVLDHIANSLLHLPAGGNVGQVLKKTASGAQWANESGGGGGAGLQLVGTYSVSSRNTATFDPPAGTTGLLCMVTYSSNTYTALIPFDALTTSYVPYGISASNTYVEIRLKNDGGTVSMNRSSTSAYNITVYAI